MRLQNFALVLLLMGLACGCDLFLPYERGYETDDTMLLRPGEPQFERGEPIAWLDWTGDNLMSLPAKIVFWDWRLYNHNISKATEQKLRGYLRYNGINNVKVRLNQYAPGDEWSRWWRNEAVGPLWKYTLGVWQMTLYTVFPDRLFAGFPVVGGGDSYNTFSNTIHLYSDHGAIALHEGGHAKDYAMCNWKGTWAVCRVIPLIPLYQEAWASGDAMAYERVVRDVQGLKEANEILYPAYMSYVGGVYQGGNIFLDGGVKIAAIMVGHVIGQVNSAYVEDPLPPVETQYEELE